jgi:imidazolonepropionase-like amidohydrolase
VLDVRTGNVLERVNVVIEGDRIVSIGAAELPEGMARVDVTGKTLIPGLFDLHAHVMPKSFFFPSAEEPEQALAILLESGITTIRLLPLHSESALGWAARVNLGELAGPTIVPASGIFEQQAQRTSQGFGDAPTAVAWVRKEALLGARWIKVYDAMDPESLAAIVQTARSYGLRVCGHTESVPPLESSRLGLSSIEHMVSLPLSCLLEGAEPPDRLRLSERIAWRWQHVDPERATALLEELCANGTAWVPTLVVTAAMLHERSKPMTEAGAEKAADGGAPGDEEARQEGAGDREAGGGESGTGEVGEGAAGAEVLDPAQQEARRALEAALRSSAQMAVRYHRMGGLVGVGTDFPIGGVPVGSSVHRELELLVDLGGATPLEALQMATLGSARVLGFEDLIGTLEPGRIADVVVLAGNPLESIAHTRAIELVVHDGRLLESD